MMPEKQNAWNRLDAVIRWAGMTTNSFAHHIGLARGENLYQIKRGNNGISLLLADRIIHYFPEIDRLWLLTGEGAMFVQQRAVGEMIPYYNVDLESSMHRLDSLKAEQMFCLPLLRDCDLAINYLGRAMGERTPAGSVVLLQKIDREAIIPGSEYVVVAKKIVTLRIIRAAEEAAYIRLVAADSANFDEVLLPIADIEALYAVRGKLIINN